MTKKLTKNSATYQQFLSDSKRLVDDNGWITRRPTPTERKWLLIAGYTEFDFVEVHRCGDVFLQFGIKSGEGHERFYEGGGNKCSRHTHHQNL